ncbi:MAG: hypothetical protein GKR89_01340 [Candidatus Latescibacteria bacterium]|nr:hypothetical protein [Candidatus Latescibacterota bacterium]
MAVRTMGRWPTKGELLEYYARSEVVSVLYDQARRWQVLAQMGRDILLQPQRPADVRDALLRGLEEFSPGVGLDQRLTTYPTIHILRQREGLSVGQDYMLETDPQTWSQAFYQIGRAVEVLETVGAFYRLKFSGHRSLHLSIPAEAFPAQVRGQAIGGSIEELHKRLDAFLQVPGHIDSPKGLRALYSTHPRSGLVSLPLTRGQLAHFQPWMASIHTIQVDSAWLGLPADAVARTERLLEAVLEQPVDQPLAVVAPLVQEQAVAQYQEGPPWSLDQVQAGLGAAESAQRVAAARAVMVQGMDLESGQRLRLLADDEPDVVWFATAAALRQRQPVSVHEMNYLLAPKDEYLLGLSDQVMNQNGPTAAALADFLAAQICVSRSTATAAVKLAEWDWPRLQSLPELLPADSLEAWFERAWVVCASSLALGWDPAPDPVFAAAQRRLAALDGPASQREELGRQLEWLLQLRNSGSRKVKDGPLVTAAQALKDQGRDLRAVVMTLLQSPAISAASAAICLLPLGWWDDCLPRLIGQLDGSKARRKLAFRLLWEMGEEAVEALLAVLQNERYASRVQVACIMALGKIGDERAVPQLRAMLTHRHRKIGTGAAWVLEHDFGLAAA